jgi:RimJ/RimL family protein N-acetyltransferase
MKPSSEKARTVTPPIEELVGTFVRLRPLGGGDAEMTLRWRMSRRAALLNPGARTVDQQREWIASRPLSEYNFIIEAGPGRAVGMVSLIDINMNHRRAEPARFLIGEPELVRGIPAAVEAMKLVYELAFDRLHLVRVHGIMAAGNRAMVTWQKYLGMREEGRLRSHYFMDGKFQDAVCLGLLVDEYRTITLPRMRALMAMAAEEKR